MLLYPVYSTHRGRVHFRIHRHDDTPSHGVTYVCHMTIFSPSSTRMFKWCFTIGCFTLTHTHSSSCYVHTNNKCKKTVVYHLVNGSMVLLRIENSKNDRLKVILLVAVWLNVNTLHSNITFSLSKSTPHLNITRSRFWPIWVAWRHRSRDHSTPHMPFPICALL